MISFKNSVPALPVVSIKKAVDFYQTKMGFNARNQEETFAILVRGNVEIHLWQACDKSWKFRSLVLFLKPIWSGAETFIAGTASCRVEVEGIDELYSEYKAQGVLHGEHSVVEEQYWGHRDLATLDLYGNLITFYEVVS
ncbi:bleomycin resistance family protein [Pedobacter yonginense]|uniref:Bleomycin resistance protein n=1 Tax=Pedobacter yonginense TaxID=651869 RepID=A0A317ERJ0_9SPHI|nr:bleomycin resistance family protein [Pedobacter yonginense]PWS28459.1 bleomycin resistance family protein [Pedobacter yonginense]